MIPNKVDRYEILSAVGTGGMGRVYRARMQGPGGASKQVALKVMHPHLADDDDFVALFLDEMRVAMGLSHRNIVQTFDAGKSDEDYFMVMELIEGCSLRRLLAARGGSGPMPLDVALFVGMEISAALEYAHRFQPDGARRAGVLHRDVSPSNVLLSGEGDVKLADFGVAKAAGGRHVTAANHAPGKHQYMAPEQARGEPGTRSDLFALGVVLYELVTGQPMPRPSAFEGLQQTTLPAPPSSLKHGLPPAFDTLILRCLEPEPADRIGSASELRTELSALSFDQQQAGGTRDSHARLRQFLADSDVLDKPPTVAGHLAQAVLDQVQGLETNPSLSPIDERGGDPPEVAVTVSESMAKRQPGWLTNRRATLLAIVLLLLAAGVWAFSRIDGKPPPAAMPSIGGDDIGAVATALDSAMVGDIATETAPIDQGVAKVDRKLPASPPKRRRRFGLLDINSLPWAKVYVNGRYRGETPLQRLRLRAGPHTVRLVSRGGKLSRSYKVRVLAGKRRSRVFDLTK